jgi:hypothetical protein
MEEHNIQSTFESHLHSPSSQPCFLLFREFRPRINADHGLKPLLHRNTEAQRRSFKVLSLNIPYFGWMMRLGEPELGRRKS